MPKGEFYDLGMDPKRMGEATEKKHYPSFHLDVEKLPAVKGMKIGELGQAEIKFKINGSSFEVQAIKFAGSKTGEEGHENGGK